MAYEPLNLQLNPQTLEALQRMQAENYAAIPGATTPDTKLSSMFSSPDVAQTSAGAPAGMSNSQIAGIGGAGVQAAGQTFAQIMQAIAQKQAREAQLEQSIKDTSTSENISGTRLKTSADDADAKNKMDAIAQLLKFGQQQTATDSKGTALRQGGTDAVTSGLLSAFRRGR